MAGITAVAATHIVLELPGATPAEASVMAVASEGVKLSEASLISAFDMVQAVNRVQLRLTTCVRRERRL